MRSFHKEKEREAKPPPQFILVCTAYVNCYVLHPSEFIHVIQEMKETQVEKEASLPGNPPALSEPGDLPRPMIPL